MLAELEIVPIGTATPSVGSVVVEIAKLIDASGLRYRVGAMGTVVEGEWEPIMALAKRCHEAARAATGRVMTTIRLDDRTDKPGSRIVEKVRAVEAKVGKPLVRDT